MQFLLNIFGFILLQVQQVPVPKDLTLPLPLPEWLLVFLLVVSFLVHILFINLMFGGTLLTLFFEVLGYIKKNEDYDKLSLEIAKTTTVNKSMAVVMGVAPLLTINTLYTLYFYSANALTGLMWIMIIPLVTIAFLLLYAHKYSYNTLRNNKPLHIGILALAAALFLFIPLIFLTNVNLMIQPEKWAMVKGFLSALMLPNVWPRYFHFIFASLGVTGLFLFWWFGRKSYEFDEVFKSLPKQDLRKRFYSITFFASAAQFLIGPIVLLTLPVKGLSWPMILVIATGAAIAIPALIALWKEITGDPAEMGKRFGWIAGYLTFTVIFMGSGRHMYRATSLEGHQKLVKAKTEEYMAQVEEAKQEALAPKKESEAKVVLSAGETVFENNCKAFHAIDEKVVGPSFKEAADIYKNDKVGLQAWIKKPGKKREGPAMPAQTHLSEKEVADVADWILTLNK
jgi:cytochrome c